MVDKCVSSLGFLKRLNTLRGPRHPTCLPGEHCFEVWKITIKVTDEQYLQNGETWHLKELLGKKGLPQEKGRRSHTCRRERSSGPG